jgi:hypothetical protein
MIRGARDERGWNRERLSVEATEELRKGAADFLSPLFVTTEERQLWRVIEVSARQIEILETRPVQPTSDPVSRSALRGVLLALKLDFIAVCRILGV